ncbi:MAG: peptidase M23 [Flavobacteriales bacterium]|nr:peptidase M23 [Flavobacteriales bacterium]|tara:strand:- start:2925 stop:4205 length:1281 start_codon:yes stop_codon:yes gene_type:complete
MQIIYSIIIILLLSGCQSTSKDPIIEVPENTAEYLYNIQINGFQIINETVRNGQNVGEILNQHNISFVDIDKVARLSKKVFDLRDVKAGGEYTLMFKDSATIKPSYFIYEINKVDFLVTKLEDSIQVYLDKKDVTIKEKTGSGIINSSLWFAMEESNLSAKLVNILADEIYPWTIDFFRLNSGDKFKVIYDAKYVNDEFIGVGKVHAALFHSNNEDYYAIAFNELGGFEDYFDENGNNLRKFFLKAPVSFTRISSRFTKKRKHPVTGRWKGHFGTDFAAPIGTPIYSTADGQVIEASYTKYNGYYVKIRHNSTYTTQYLHMDKSSKKLWSKKGIKKGKHVRQGVDIIGYVGRSGQATGPHVCYRFWKNGKQVDPFKTKLPEATPVNKSKRMEFEKRKKIWLEKLATINYPNEYFDADSIEAVTLQF